tara:strand:+ start:880 stop:1278 length:399 start_codon:yes stop_codon:yes gene_type:complete
MKLFKKSTQKCLLLMSALLLLVLLVNNNSFHEGMRKMGASLDYQMGNGVVLTDGKQPWDVRKMALSNGVKQTYEPYNLPPRRMSVFDEIKFDPRCCPSDVSTGAGCACAPENLIKYISQQRGGNNSKNCGAI